MKIFRVLLLLGSLILLPVFALAESLSGLYRPSPYVPVVSFESRNLTTATAPVAAPQWIVLAYGKEMDAHDRAMLVTRLLREEWVRGIYQVVVHRDGVRALGICRQISACLQQSARFQLNPRLSYTDARSFTTVLGLPEWTPVLFASFASPIRILPARVRPFCHQCSSIALASLGVAFDMYDVNVEWTLDQWLESLVRSKVREIRFTLPSNAKVTRVDRSKTTPEEIQLFGHLVRSVAAPRSLRVPKVGRESRGKEVRPLIQPKKDLAKQPDYTVPAAPLMMLAQTRGRDPLGATNPTGPTETIRSCETTMSDATTNPKALSAILECYRASRLSANEIFAKAAELASKGDAGAETLWLEIVHHPTLGPRAAQLAFESVSKNSTKADVARFATELLRRASFPSDLFLRLLRCAEMNPDGKALSELIAHLVAHGVPNGTERELEDFALRFSAPLPPISPKATPIRLVERRDEILRNALGQRSVPSGPFLLGDRQRILQAIGFPKRVVGIRTGDIDFSHIAALVSRLSEEERNSIRKLARTFPEVYRVAVEGGSTTSNQVRKRALLLQSERPRLDSSRTRLLMEVWWWEILPPNARTHSLPELLVDIVDFTLNDPRHGMIVRSFTGQDVSLSTSLARSFRAGRATADKVIAAGELLSSIWSNENPATLARVEEWARIAGLRLSSDTVRHSSLREDILDEVVVHWTPGALAVVGALSARVSDEAIEINPTSFRKLIRAVDRRHLSPAAVVAALRSAQRLVSLNYCGTDILACTEDIVQSFDPPWIAVLDGTTQRVESGVLPKGVLGVVRAKALASPGEWPSFLALLVAATALPEAEALTLATLVSQTQRDAGAVRPIQFSIAKAVTATQQCVSITRRRTAARFWGEGISSQMSPARVLKGLTNLIANGDKECQVSEGAFDPGLAQAIEAFTPLQAGQSLGVEEHIGLVLLADSLTAVRNEVASLPQQTVDSWMRHGAIRVLMQRNGSLSTTAEVSAGFLLWAGLDLDGTNPFSSARPSQGILPIRAALLKALAGGFATQNERHVVIAEILRRGTSNHLTKLVY